MMFKQNAVPVEALARGHPTSSVESDLHHTEEYVTVRSCAAKNGNNKNTLRLSPKLCFF